MIAPPLSLYVHLPWCVRKCPYCDFNSFTLRTALPEAAYTAALDRDLESQARELGGRTVISIFFGGGTPSLFSPEAIGRVLEAARRHFDVAPDAEVTLEANPGTIERGRFAGYRDAGVNRVSLGAQSFDARRLETLGRIHSPAQIRLAAEELHAAGLSNFNLDLMYALPGQGVAGAVRDVIEALSLVPAHISHYQLTLEPGTPFGARPPPGLPTDDTAAEMLTACQERLAAAGLERYEVSAYARPGHQCRHNLNYWTFGDYVGAGAGAHGKLTLAPGTIVRTVQQREPRRYQAASPRAIARRPVASADLPFEFVLNALRLPGGFGLALYGERTGLCWEDLAPKVDSLARRGFLELGPERCRPTELGLRFLNEVLLELLPERPELSGKAALSTVF